MSSIFVSKMEKLTATTCHIQRSLNALKELPRVASYNIKDFPGSKKAVCCAFILVQHRLFRSPRPIAVLEKALFLISSIHSKASSYAECKTLKCAL